MVSIIQKQVSAVWYDPRSYLILSLNETCESMEWISRLNPSLVIQGGGRVILGSRSFMILLNPNLSENGEINVFSVNIHSTRSKPSEISLQTVIYRPGKLVDLLPSLNISHFWRMAAHVREITKNMARHLIHLVSETSQNLRMMEATDDFNLLQELGEGTYGKVLMGKHKNSGQVVAVKMLAKEKVPKDNFLLEYSISLALSCHPNIILTHEIAFQTSRDYVFIQEVAPAGNLQSIIKPKVGLQEDTVKRCVPQIANAMDFMHNRGMVHRDLKLDNILLMDPECHQIKLADFGLTRLQGTYTPYLSWTIPYTAPELCCQKPWKQLLLHPNLDVWAFGVLIYTALTGFFPWRTAMSCDHRYKEFAWWRVERESPTPEKWKKISAEARGMFWDMFAERCSVMDVLKYMQVPWKAEFSS
ncbi:serine/threonine-protein kinase SBK1-like [Hyla sarda]|uniref:serine/threonine-protein kinase SBK1-like n=1 Tax=Hyla sarda TaxID=327740 RepID=UPI0024C28BAA|nr:serine/threonine-protein kinase SBK1-like [Hyla sarda]